MNTDWGLRDVANTESVYDGLSYHQGSVWPLFTGWAALAEYRGGQPVAGYQLLMENANLTRAQDLGAVTELLSGDFFVPFGRSTSHQLWSSAMVITPTLRGLFGLSIDTQSKTISVDPRLPATWDHASIHNLHIGADTVDLDFTQSHETVTVALGGAGAKAVKLHSNNPRNELSSKIAPSGVSSSDRLVFARPPVEVAPIFEPPVPGDRTRSFRVLNEQHSERKLTLTLEGPANTDAQLPLVLNAMNLHLRADGASVPTASGAAGHTLGSAPVLHVHFPGGEGWVTVTVVIAW